ncbi:MAG: hypothetical protein M3Y42_19295, partial [Actinomycetota bacterium]|nr:hypothetical protein [Actinomycetota bacterium]
MLLTVVVVGQAGLLGLFASRGWFYADDLSYMSQATGRSLGWGYLTASLNDHFVPGLRLVFWIINRTTRLDYGITILARLLVQAASTLLLYRLLVLLVGRRPGVLLVLAWYAFGPLLMPGSVWLTTSVHLMSAQLLVILAIDLHVRYSVSGRLLLAVGSTACLLGGVLFWELSGITALILPIVSLGFVHSGPLGQRLRQSLRRWPGWLILGAVLGSWLAVFLGGPYGGSAHPFGARDALQVLKVGWLDALGPALVGGPWRWFYYGDVYFPVADPPWPMVVLAQVCVLAVLVVAVRRTGRRALLAWSIPLLTFVIGTVTVSVGRFWIYGDLSPRAFNYAFILAVPAALAAGLSLLPSS